MCLEWFRVGDGIAGAAAGGGSLWGRWVLVDMVEEAFCTWMGRVCVDDDGNEGVDGKARRGREGELFRKHVRRRKAKGIGRSMYLNRKHALEFCLC